MNDNLNKLQNNFHIALRRFFKTPITNPEQYGRLVNSYRQLRSARDSVVGESEIKPQKVFVKTHFDIGKFKSYGWQYSVINFLKEEVDTKLSDFIIAFLIHGSFATKDFLPNWSDLDTLIILDNKVFEDIENLKYVYKTIRKLALLCYKIDPLAHHEFEFITEFDLKYYPQYLFPPIIYDYSILLSGKSELEITLRPDDREKIQRMAKFVNYFREKIINGDFSKNKFFWKNDLSHIMLWPSFLLQAQNLYLYKRHSFEKAKEKFSSVNFSVVDGATLVMKNWKRFNLLRYYPNALINLLPYGVNEKLIYLFRHLARSQSPEQSKDLIKSITEDALKLMESSG